MARLRLVLAAVATLAATPALCLDVFQCVDEHGALRFVDRREACDGAKPYEFRGAIDRSAESGPDPSGADVPASLGSQGRDLEGLLLSARQVGPGWEVVAEAPIDVAADEDFRSWGVRDQLARHYTRGGGGLIQVCSIEIWSFKSINDARVAARNISYPTWQIDREDDMLVMIHGVSKSRAGSPQLGVFPACDQLGDLQRLRMAESVKRQ